MALTTAEFLSGGLYNGLGRYEAALAAVAPAERFYTEGPAIWALTELIEAAVRCGQPERAERAFERVKRQLAPPAPTGRSESRLAYAHCSAIAMTMTPMSSTWRRSPGLLVHASACSSLVPTSFTANGCGVSADA